MKKLSCINFQVNWVMGKNGSQKTILSELKQMCVENDIRTRIRMEFQFEFFEIW